MTSFARWILAGLSPLLFATAHADDAPVSSVLAARVAARLAESWNVPVARVRLAWGRSTSGRTPPDDAAFRIVGRGTDGWFVIVFDPTGPAATAVRLRAGLEQPVMVAARALRAGSRVAAGDLREEVRVRWGGPPAEGVQVPGPGWDVRRALASGEVASPPAVEAPPLVQAGEPVRLEWSSGDVQLSLVGIALNAARAGELVRARLEERPARVVARVTAPGRAVLAAGARP